MSLKIADWLMEAVLLSLWTHLVKFKKSYISKKVLKWLAGPKIKVWTVLTGEYTQVTLPGFKPGMVKSPWEFLFRHFIWTNELSPTVSHSKKEGTYSVSPPFTYMASPHLHTWCHPRLHTRCHSFTCMVSLVYIHGGTPIYIHGVTLVYIHNGTLVYIHGGTLIYIHGLTLIYRSGPSGNLAGNFLWVRVFAHS